MDALRIRDATRADAVPVPGLRTMAAGGTGVRLDAEDIARLIDPDAPPLAERDGTPTDTVTAGFDGRPRHLHRPPVHPDRHRHGITGVLPRAAKERVTEPGGRRGDAMVPKRDERDERDDHARRAAGHAPERHRRRRTNPSRGPVARRPGPGRTPVAHPGRVPRLSLASVLPTMGVWTSLRVRHASGPVAHAGGARPAPA